MKGQLIFWSLFTLIFILSVFLWWNIKTINNFYDPYSYLSVSIILVFDLALFSLFIFLFNSSSIYLTTIILPFSYLGVFGINKYLVISSFISALAIFTAIRLVNFNKEKLIKLDFLSTSHKSNKRLNFAFIILIVGLLYSYLLTINSFSVPRVLFDQVLEYSKPILSQSIGFSDFNISIDDFILRQGLNKSKTPINAELIKNIKLNQSQEIKVSRRELSKSFNLEELNGNEPVSAVLYNIINNYTVRISNQYSGFIPLGVTSLGLIFSWSIFTVLSWISGLLGLGLFSLLKVTKLVRIDSVDIKKEIINLK